jgi:hypothetical protein
MSKKYIAHNDPGHGWLAVKRSELKELGIAGKVTLYSYERGETVYLEEDCDATLFIDAHKAKHGADPEIEDRYSNGSSPIRSYAAYVPDADDLKPYVVSKENK